MKKVSIVYYNRNDWLIIEHIRKNLESVFVDQVHFENVFLEEMGEDEQLESDLFLVLYDDYIHSLSPHIQNLNRVVTITRGINRKHIDELKNIKTATDILVVNDANLSTLQTAYILQGLGMDHITFVPYNRLLDKDHLYDHMKIAITTNAVTYVPRYISKIISIGYREVGYGTLAKIMHKLKINNDQVFRNILKKMHDIIEAGTDIKTDDIINSYLKSEMLDKAIANSSDGVLLTDNGYNLVYYNKSADMIFQIEDHQETYNLRDLMDEKTYHALSSRMKTKYLKIRDEDYLIEKSTLKVMEMNIGYYMLFRKEKAIRDLEINLKGILMEKGQVAKYSFEDILYRSASMEACIRLAKKSSLTDHTILIEGESGTGKELIAQSIHKYSFRKEAPFVAINCAALPETLLESELFGYEEGAFTGAKKSGKLGLFEQADKGTIFLDEIGDISPNLQRQLLRVLQERQIMRIGSDRLIDIDVRIIVATNKILLDEVHKGHFRSDLYYRLNVIPIVIPPLRERKEDIQIILKDRLGEQYHNLSAKEKENILAYDWPGNIRELESAASYYKTLHHLPDYVRSQKHSPAILEHNLHDLVLEIVGENTEPYSGIGRNTILKALKEKGVSIGDARLREILQELKAKEFVDIQRGRGGTRATPDGIHYLTKLH